MDFDEMRAALQRAQPPARKTNVNTAITGRLPWEPLASFLAPRQMTQAETAIVCGVDERTIVRWQREGLTLRAADHVAIRLGQHPLSIWGERYWLAE